MRSFHDVLPGPFRTVATSKGFREQMRWAFRVESVKKANIIDDEEIVLRDNCSDDFPPRMIGNKAGNLDVRKVHIHVK